VIGVGGWIGHWTGALAEPFDRLDPGLTLLALACQAGNLAARAFAWRNVLAAAYPKRRIRVIRVGAAYAAGVALNGYLPARGGEAAKIALVRAQLPGTSAVAIASASSVLLVFDALVGGSLLAFAVASGLAAPPTLPSTGGETVALAVLALVAVAWLTVRLLGPRLQRALGDARSGIAVLRSPRRYLGTVASVQALAWCFRIAAVACLLAAFGLPASPELAAFVVVLGGLSTAVPAGPGGAGAQQLLVVYGLHGAVSTSAALSFSIGMQAGVTAVNTAVGIAAAVLVLRTVRPLRAVRAASRAR
jgi:uncharacterized membrane protein YbhN (UPF0104 family)